MKWQRFWNTIRTAPIEREIDREVAFHVEERVDELVAQGWNEMDARREAQAQFGNRMLQAERVRDADVWGWLDRRLRDVRHAARALAHSPGFAATVIATLAIGIGANTAVFSAIDAVLLRPLPFTDGDRLVQLRQVQERSAESNIAPIRLEDWNRMSSTFEAITGYYTENVTDTSGAIPERVRRAFVAPRFLKVWGIAPAVGRGFTEVDHRGSGMPVVIVSDRYWRARMNAAPNALGRTVRIGSTGYQIVGVMPRSFLFPDRAVDLWLPVGIDNGYASSRLATWYLGVGRLKGGVSLADARANLALVQSQLGLQYPATDSKLGVDVQLLKEVTIGATRQSLWVVFGAVTVLLLITCTNVAALLLSRAVQRRREVAVRVALGASRRAVAAHVLTETLLLVIAGAGFGLLLAVGALHLARASAPDLPRLDEVVLDARIVGYTLLVVPSVRTSGALRRWDRRRISSSLA
jgi:putative ABC transport system permease protein